MGGIMGRYVCVFVSDYVCASKDDWSLTQLHGVTKEDKYEGR